MVFNVNTIFTWEVDYLKFCHLGVYTFWHNLCKFTNKIVSIKKPHWILSNRLYNRENNQFFLDYPFNLFFVN